MSTRNGHIPTGALILRLIRSQPWRYALSLSLWTLIWTMPVVVGLIVAAFFDTLNEAEAGFDLTTLIAGLWAYGLARIGLVFLGLRNHSRLLFRAGTLMKRNLLGWIYSLPGAHPVDETPGEVVSRFRDDTEHVVEAFDFTVDLVGSSLSAAIAIAILATIDPLKRTVALGWMCRRAIAAKPNRLILAGMFLIFGPDVFLMVVGVWGTVGWPLGWDDVVAFPLGVFMLFIYCGVLYRLV